MTRLTDAELYRRGSDTLLTSWEEYARGRCGGEAPPGPRATPGARQARGENRWPAAIAVPAASGLQMTLPRWLAFGPQTKP